MKLSKYRSAFLICWFFPFLLNAGDSVKLLPEVGEWGTGGLAFYAAKWLDHQPAWRERSIGKKPTDRPFHENTVSSSQLYGAAGITALGIGFIPNDDGWLKRSAYHHSKGLVQALAFTYLATNITKNIVGRRRPSFANYPAGERVDANKSIPSGHTSISFAIASYSSLYALDHFGAEDSKIGPVIYSSVSHLLAAWVGYTRIVDNRHFISDVIAGGLLGSGVAWLVYDYQASKFDSENPQNGTNKNILPWSIRFSIPL